MDSMHFTLSAYGVRIPKIIYGTAWKKEHTAALVEQAVDAGFRGIDTACQPKHYHEAGVGDGLAACFQRDLLARNELYLQSKFTPLNGHDPERVPYDPAAPLAEQVTQSFAASLANLQTGYLDGLILHSPLANPDDTLAVWRAMEDLVDAGGVRQLGVSNCYSLPQLEFLYERARLKPAVLQNRFYAETGYDHKLRIFCNRHDIIYQSFWTLTANPKLLQQPNTLELAEKYRRNPAQVVFRYLSQIGIIPLTGATQLQHMREDLAIFEFELTPSECDALTALLVASD